LAEGWLPGPRGGDPKGSLRILTTTPAAKPVAGSDAVYTGCWGGAGPKQEKKGGKRARRFFRSYQVEGPALMPIASLMRRFIRSGPSAFGRPGGGTDQVIDS